jgi:hypothetical protein
MELVSRKQDSNGGALKIGGYLRQVQGAKARLRVGGNSGATLSHFTDERDGARWVAAGYVVADFLKIAVGKARGA